MSFWCENQDCDVFWNLRDKNLEEKDLSHKINCYIKNLENEWECKDCEYNYAIRNHLNLTAFITEEIEGNPSLLETVILNYDIKTIVSLVVVEDIDIANYRNSKKKNAIGILHSGMHRYDSSHLSCIFIDMYKLFVKFGVDENNVDGEGRHLVDCFFRYFQEYKRCNLAESMRDDLDTALFFVSFFGHELEKRNIRL